MTRQCAKQLTHYALGQMPQLITNVLMLAHLTVKVKLIALPIKAVHSLIILALLKPLALPLLKLIARMQITALTMLIHAFLNQVLT